MKRALEWLPAHSFENAESSEQITQLFNPQKPQRVNMCTGYWVWTVKPHSEEPVLRALPLSGQQPTWRDFTERGQSGAGGTQLLLCVSVLMPLVLNLRCCSCSEFSSPSIFLSIRTRNLDLCLVHSSSHPGQFRFLNLRHVSSFSFQPRLGFWRSPLSYLCRFWFLTGM